MNKHELRKLIAKVIITEGCSCCQGEDHRVLKDELARVLDIPPYEDNGGYDWYAVAEENETQE